MASRVPQKLTVDALDAFDDDARVELIDGLLVPGSATSFEHGDAQVSMSVELHAKRRVLHVCGVPHYWIVDLDVPLLTLLRHAADGYLIAKTAEPGERARLEPFDAIEIEVARLFGDI